MTKVSASEIVDEIKLSIRKILKKIFLYQNTILNNQFLQKFLKYAKNLDEKKS